jgi:hypothetical protein
MPDRNSDSFDFGSSRSANKLGRVSTPDNLLDNSANFSRPKTPQPSEITTLPPLKNRPATRTPSTESRAVPKQDAKERSDAKQSKGPSQTARMKTAQSPKQNMINGMTNQIRASEASFSSQLDIEDRGLVPSFNTPSQKVLALDTSQSAAEATQRTHVALPPSNYSLSTINCWLGVVPSNSTEQKQGRTSSCQDMSDNALQSRLISSSDRLEATATGRSRTASAPLGNAPTNEGASGPNSNLIYASDEAEDDGDDDDEESVKDGSSNAELDRKVDAMLTHIIDLACRATEWLDYLSPQDYIINPRDYSIAEEAGHYDAYSLLRAAFHKIDDDSAKQYNELMFPYGKIEVALKLQDKPSYIAITKVWEPYSSLALLFEKQSRMLFAGKAKVCSSLWKEVVSKAPYLFYARQDRRFIRRPRKWSFVVLFVITCASQMELKKALGVLALGEDHSKTYHDQVSDSLKLLRHGHKEYATMTTPDITFIWNCLHEKLLAESMQGKKVRSTDSDGCEGGGKHCAKNQMTCLGSQESTTSMRGEKRKSGGQHGSKGMIQTKKKKKAN